jgi:hypothetical protein
MLTLRERQHKIWNAVPFFYGRFLVYLVDEEIWLNYKSQVDKKIPSIIEAAIRICGLNLSIGT